MVISNKPPTVGHHKVVTNLDHELRGVYTHEYWCMYGIHICYIYCILVEG